MRMTMRLDLDAGAVGARLRGRLVAAQAALDEAVLRDCAPYVPRDTGALMASGQALGGEVAYTAPYARHVYYGHGLRFRTDRNPQACAQWFERAKAAHGAQWVQAVRAMVE